MDNRKDFNVTNKKCSIDEVDIPQIKMYLNSKGFEMTHEDNNSKFLYILKGSYYLSSVLSNIDLTVMDYKDFKEEIYEPIKESNNKLKYELDWRFVQQIAERMASNKSKYPPFNWKKEMSAEQLYEIKEATTRHFIEFIEGNYEDDGRELGHIEGIVCNLMIINYQLKIK